jgi:hypothetical protein
MMFVIAELKNEAGQTIGLINLPQKLFKTGSRGYYANTKIEMDGKRYQVQVQMVEIGSKTQAEE